MFDQISLNSKDASGQASGGIDLQKMNADKKNPFKKVDGDAEDMFGETEKVGTPRVERPAAANPLPNAVRPIASTPVTVMPQQKPSTTPNYQPGVVNGGKKSNVFLTILIVVLLLLAAGLAGWWAYGKYFKSQQLVDNENNSQVEDTLKKFSESLNDQIPTTTSEQQTNNDEVAPNENINTTAEGGLDTDGDGLTDAEELKLGTNPDRVDSDVDALSDYDEVKQWQTNPLNPDTDGDGYFDGEEVKNGYNPLGEGKLIQ